MDNIYDTMKTTIENEEGVPIEYVTNMDEVKITYFIHYCCMPYFPF